MTWLWEFLPIVALLAVVAVVVWRMPQVDVGHSAAYRRRRATNWLTVGLTYAFLYMARYNLNAFSNAGASTIAKDAFGTIFAIGTVTYGVSFLVNGPLTDRLGGRATIIISAVGSGVANILMGLVVAAKVSAGLVPVFAVLYAVNMYFQSFGAVSIVKVNAAWFHLNERGTFGGIFGILISLGLYFAFDFGRLIMTHAPPQWVFFVPALILIGFAILDFLLVRDTPGQAGHRDFDTADASSGDDGGPKLGVVELGLRMFSNPVILTIALVEFCSGYLRNAIMQWYRYFAADTGQAQGFVNVHWGMLLCIAGILGGMFAGVISDRFFQSRRGPVSAVLYGGMVLGALGMWLVLETPVLGWLVVFMSLCIIGVHGMLSGTASMDFGGKKNVGIAVGIIDGFVYLGTGLQGLVLGQVLPEGVAKKDPANWWTWPAAMLPFAVIGFLLAMRVWHAKPKRVMHH